MRYSTSALLLSSSFLLGGCAAFNRLELHRHSTVSIGDELTDLSKAKDAGLLNDAEYAKAREGILTWNTVIKIGPHASDAPHSEKPPLGTPP